MKLRLTISAIALALLAAQPASAACPAPAPGKTAEEIRANQERLLCLQRELADLGAERKYQVEIDSIGRSLDHLQLQYRFDSLDFTPPTVPQF